MKIPKKIKIVGKEIDVVWDDNLCNEKKVYGESDYDKGRILLQKTVMSYPRKKEFIDVTFIHEVLHFILNMMDYSDLGSDEGFVTRISELLYQVIEQIKD